MKKGNYKSCNSPVYWMCTGNTVMPQWYEILLLLLLSKCLLVWVRLQYDDRPAVSLKLKPSAKFEELIEKAKETYQVNELNVECTGQQPELEELVVDVMVAKNAGHHEMAPFFMMVRARYLQGVQTIRVC